MIVSLKLHAFLSAPLRLDNLTIQFPPIRGLLQGGSMTRRHRRHSIAKKREAVEACLNGEALRTLSQRHDVSRRLIRTWIEKHERGACDDDAVEADLLSACKAGIAALERLVGRQALEIEFPEGARVRGQPQRDGSGSVITGPLASRSDAGVTS